MATSQIGHNPDDIPIWQRANLSVGAQRVAIEFLIDHPPAEWSGLDREGRRREARRLIKRLESGDPFSVLLRSAMPAVDELQLLYGLSASGAWAVLRKHNAPRSGRKFAPLTPGLRQAIQDERLLAWGRKVAAQRRVADTGCSWASAVRWAHRQERSVERLDPPADARTVAGQARTIARLAALYPDNIR